MMKRGSGIADPGVRTVINFYEDARIREYGPGHNTFLGSADPGLRIRASEPLLIFYDAARIRECGSGRAEPFSKIFMTPPYPGMRIRACRTALKKSMMMHGSRTADWASQPHPFFFYDDARIQKCGSGHHTFLET
jgi:hypothetical protein